MLWTIVTRYKGGWIIPYSMAKRFPEGITYSEAMTLRYCEFDHKSDADCKVVSMADALALTGDYALAA